MKAEILRLLREQEEYLSGQELCSRFQVSRTAVWKSVSQLREEGYGIEAVRNRGYRLSSSPDLLSKTELESRMTTRWAGRNVVYFEETDSTNDAAKRLADSGAVHGTLVVAERQTGGKGRRGRFWNSPPGTGVWMSIILRPNLPPSSASMITLPAAMAVSAGIREVSCCPSQIKWPNDVICGGKKVCGILTEMSAEMESIHYVVVGIGINVNIKEFPEEISGAATSLYLQQGREIKRSPLAACVIGHFENFYEELESRGDLSALKDRYEGELANKGRAVRVSSPGVGFTGTALGIDEEGRLLVVKENGEQTAVASGEVSVRGVYGYV